MHTARVPPRALPALLVDVGRRICITAALGFPATVPPVLPFDYTQEQLSYQVLHGLVEVLLVLGRLIKVNKVSSSETGANHNADSLQRAERQGESKYAGC